MLGIEDYGSDVESGGETLNTASKTTPTPSTSSLLSKLPPPTSKPTPKSSSSSSLSLPEPSRSSSITHTKNSATAPKPKRTKKIAINLPSLPPPEDDEDDGPPAKKPRVASSTGAGKSSLLSRLPAPKQPAPVIEKKEERVLGGGGGPGLVFRTSTSQTRRPDTAGVAGTEESLVDVYDAGVKEVDGPIDVSAPSTSFLPPSLKKGKANISLEDQGPYKRPPSTATQPQKAALPAPGLDFFSLGSSTPPARSTPTPSTSSASTTTSAPSASAPASVSSSFTVSSAPAISTFRPPSPTLDDAYPGYYQLPSGAYAPYDADYYASYAKKWKADYDKHIRALEKSQYQPETDGAQDVDMAAEMEKARREIKEREDRKALTMGMTGQNDNGEPAMPRMNVKGAKLGTVARSRHQLSTLLTEAYLNRESLEEKIAQGRRNRKEAGMKYGF
ncbi:mitotic checkpoint regulator, MAD2B-interacting-domain-containing protein [Boletus reticuloceps]|uniref:Mitotic checkpoint regulator, MAD2B-interacting-domain-containing protein n=1 Tax=Boletus reticuloceps TaxID=495285 RepID=A0A8I2YHE8_9AGAM|nr:mitotic checkpoint regulator, MAD2B-interacting-domain-containing protein [Boletus reticuloceps]